MQIGQMRLREQTPNNCVSSIKEVAVGSDQWRWLMCRWDDLSFFHCNFRSCRGLSNWIISARVTAVFGLQQCTLRLTATSMQTGRWCRPSLTMLLTKSRNCRPPDDLGWAWTVSRLLGNKLCTAGYHLSTSLNSLFPVTNPRTSSCWRGRRLLRWLDHVMWPNPPKSYVGLGTWRVVRLGSVNLVRLAVFMLTIILLGDDEWHHAFIDLTVWFFNCDFFSVLNVGSRIVSATFFLVILRADG